MSNRYHALEARPIYLKDANDYVKKHHRHSIPTVGCRFALSVWTVEPAVLVGVAICGRPVARLLDDGKTLEVLRVCTDGTANACSFLYARCRRIASEMGYKSCITYTLQSESGHSLRVVGAVVSGEVEGHTKGWLNRPGRTEQAVMKEPKWRWELLDTERYRKQPEESP